MRSVFAIILVCIGYNSFSQVWQWASQANGNTEDAVMAMAEDAGGNIIIAGYFQSPTLTIGSTVLTNTGNKDIYIAMYNPAGLPVWARQATGGFDEQISGIAISAGYIYLTGSYKTQITFGSQALNNPASWDEIFIVKYDFSGNVIWARKATGNKPDYCNTVAADGSGNVYIAGNFYSDTLIFGTTQLLISSPGYSDSYFAKYDAAGNVVWAKKIPVMPRDLTFSQGGHLFMTGVFSDNNVTVQGVQLLNPPYCGALFTLKLDVNGNGIWGRSVHAQNLSMSPKSVVTDAGGNVYVTGNYYNSPFTFAGMPGTYAGSDDVFVLRYDASGNESWVNTAGTLTSEYVTSLAVDAGGNVLIAGSFLMSGLSFGGHTVSNAGAYDIFVAKYSSAGTPLWALSNGGSGSEAAIDISAKSSLPVITGTFSSATASFGATTLTNTQAGKSDIYIAKLGPAAPVEEYVGAEDVTIYPNPSEGKFSVKASARITRLEVMDCLGKVIWRTEMNSDLAEVDIRNAGNGVYFMQADLEAGRLTKKILVVK